MRIPAFSLALAELHKSILVVLNVGINSFILEMVERHLEIRFMLPYRAS
jgi:hypothetical protein